MRTRNGWLFPLMVLAAGSVTVFGCIGIAAITGYLPLAKVSPTHFGGPVVIRAIERAATKLLAQPDHTVALANHPDATPAAGDPSAAKLEPGQKKPSPQ